MQGCFAPSGFISGEALAVLVFAIQAMLYATNAVSAKIRSCST
jgi:hypothetical protein